MTDAYVFKFDNSYANLPEKFFSETKPTAAQSPHLIKFNSELGKLLGVRYEGLSPSELASVFSGVSLPKGAQPLSMAYAGHQFGHFVSQLGDGRAILLGEVIDSTGHRYDIQLKGAGQTPFSRNGDGRATVGPVLREYIVSEAMYHLGIPTTRALAAVTTGDRVFRETPLPGAILTRVASSHIRVGHFEYFAARGDRDGLETLVRYTLDRHFPDAALSKDGPFLSLLREVIKKQASLISQWMDVGFIHGVMNTDNASVSGETIDFGPCAFMDEFKFNRCFSSIDRHGRYAYENQPAIAQWNMARLADCLTPLCESQSPATKEKFQEALEEFEGIYNKFWLQRFRAKLGLSSSKLEDLSLFKDWLLYLQKEQLDYTLSFRALSKLLVEDQTPSELPETDQLIHFKLRWKSRVLSETNDLSSISKKMTTKNPLFIPRNHHIEKVIEQALSGNYTLFEEMVTVLKNPFIEQQKYSKYSIGPVAGEHVTATFCGT
ncbi:YdiU family protein [Bdellovibrionales bacterium]|nr:YdiU family protein [Bdellovibrionales bacterium]